MAERKLTDICSIQYGYPFDSSCFSSSPEEGKPLIRIRDVMNGYTETYFRGDYPAEYIVHNGDYLVGMDGEFNIALWRGGDALLNQRVCKIESKAEGISTKYLYRFLKRELKKIEDETPFVTVKHLSARRLNQVFVDIPSLDEQERIVAELDLLTSIIDKQEQQLVELDTLAQSIFYDMFGNPDTNEKGWGISALNDVCTDITDGSHNPPKGGSKSDYMMLSSKNIFDGFYTIEEPRYLSKEEFATENSRTNLRRGDVLLTIVGTIGRCCVFDGAYQVALQRSVAVLKPKESINSVFLMNQLQVSRAVLENEAKGVAQKGIYLNQLKRLRIILPPISLQQSFAKKIAAIESQKGSINRSIIESQKLFDYTMNKYFG